MGPSPTNLRPISTAKMIVNDRLAVLKSSVMVSEENIPSSAKVRVFNMTITRIKFTNTPIIVIPRM